MVKMTISWLNKENVCIKAVEGTDQVYLDFKYMQYSEGDKLVFTVDRPEQYLIVKVDDAIESAKIYLPGLSWEYPIILDPEAKRAFSPRAFEGERHYVAARLASEQEINAYQNLALNPADHGESSAYPHATANVETRNESVFAARNAIDGIIATNSHGAYPYQSWGINQQADASMRVTFGRMVEIDRIGIVLRADFPHDSYWEKATFRYSDGSNEVVHFEKSGIPQYFDIQPRKVEWIEIGELIKANDDSPFPALTELEVYGKNV